jgi:hypothetical protein
MHMHRPTLALGLSLALTAAVPALALPPIFTGDAAVDFVDPSAVFYSDLPAIPDVGMPKPPFALANTSGWDMRGVWLQYDPLTDTMYVGIDCFSVCGDADDDGLPGITSANLAALLGTDVADLGSTESFAVVFDTTQVFGCPPDGAGDVVAGTASVVGANILDFDIYDYVALGCPDGFFGSGCPFTSTGSFPGDSSLVVPVNLSLFGSPSAAAPDIEFSLSPFSQLPGFTFVPGGAFAVELNLFGGSLDDAGIGEDEMVDICFEVTTTTTSTTSTTLCEGPIAEERCGNGVIDPECNEQCDPAGMEICGNMMDDDGDGLVDCADPDCSEATGPTCDETCNLETVDCKDILDDPAIIRFGTGGKPGYFSLHGRVLAAPGSFNPNVNGFTVEITNANGHVYSGSILPGDLIPGGVRNGLPSRYKFKDKTARTLGEGSLRDGIFRVGMRFRNVDGDPSFTVKLKIYGDFSLATEPRMTTQWYGVDDVGYLTADWTQTSRGWKLTLANF